MNAYNYREAVKNDVLEYVRDSYDFATELRDDRDAFEEKLRDDLWTVDSVTGNGSGSYTFNAWEAEENLCHNLDLLGEACEAFGGSVDVLKDGAESCDVTIRCYLLAGAISEALDELEGELPEEEEEEEE